MILLFASWIDKKYPRYTFIKDIKYKYKLLYRSSRNSLDATKFHEIKTYCKFANVQNSKQLANTLTREFKIIHADFFKIFFLEPFYFVYPYRFVLLLFLLQ